MLRLILPVVLLVLGAAGGVGAGLMLGGGDGSADEAAAGAADGHGSEDAAHAEPAEDGPGAGAGDGHGAGDSPAAASGLSEYVRLNNQFVVPIVQGGSVRSLVVMSLTLEVDVGRNSAVFDREPRLRDAFLRVMFAHANAGGFDGSFTQASVMDPLREALAEAARGILGPMLRDVLIVDITRQDA
jgi:flagellar protein FliL